MCLKNQKGDEKYLKEMLALLLHAIEQKEVDIVSKYNILVDKLQYFGRIKKRR